MSDRRWADEDRQAAAFYSELLRRHGDNARALNWGSKESQQARFDVLCAIGDLGGCTVLDVGCGLGDLWPTLRGRGAAAYVGIDVSADMVARARALHRDARFEVGNACAAEYPAPGRFDYVFASGIFYLHQLEPAAYLQRAVARMFGACDRGLAFNSLSSWSPGDPSEFRADPLRTLEACRGITPWVSLRHDYHPGDFTIYMHRDRRRA